MGSKDTSVAGLFSVIIMEVQQHWNKIFSTNPLEELAWYETDLGPTLRLIEKAGLLKEWRILNVGAGSTPLIDKLLAKGYTRILATDISEVALQKLRDRLGKSRVEFIVDDLTNASKLDRLQPVDLWIDRAVLHFFTNEKEREAYFSLLKKLVNHGGYVLLAQFNLRGAEKCSGLPVYRYSKELMQEKLGEEFKLIESFNYTFTMPSGDLRPYVYTLFNRQMPVR